MYPPLHDPVEDLHTNTSSVWAKVSSVTRSPSWKRTQSNWKSEKNLWCTLCLSDRHYSIKDIPSSIFSPRLQAFFCISLFEISSYTGGLVTLSLITIILIIFKLCSTVDCVFLDDVDGAVCCSMYVPCLWFGFITWRFSKRNSCWVEKKKIKFYK